MNDNQNPKNITALSDQLSEIFDHMDYINSSFCRIESYAHKKFDAVQKEINHDNNHDVSRELEYHMANFLRRLADDFENKTKRLQ